MADLDNKDLDQWIVDLDVLQHELSTAQTRQVSDYRHSVNDWNGQGSTGPNNGTNLQMSSSFKLPANSNVTNAQMTLRHQILRPAGNDCSQNQISNPVNRESAFEKYHPINHFLDPSPLYEHTLYYPVQNGSALQQTKHTLRLDQLLPTGDQRNSHYDHSPTRYHVEQPKEQKTVHWSSELRSSSNSPMHQASKPKLYVLNQPSVRQSNTGEKPIQICNHSELHRNNSSAYPKPTFSEMYYEPDIRNSIAPPRSDVIVKQNHSFNPYHCKPVRSTTVPSNLNFPLTLADLAPKESQVQTTNRTGKVTPPPVLNITLPSIHAPVPIPVTMMANQHSNLNSQQIRKGIPEDGTNLSPIYPQSRRGVIRSQSAVDYSLANSETFESEKVFHRGNYDFQFVHYKHSGQALPITVLDESRKSWGLNNYNRDINSSMQSTDTDKRPSDQLIVRVYHPNHSNKSVAIESNTSTLNVLEKLVQQNHLSWSTKYALVEKIPSLNLERVFEDNEQIMTCLGNWTVSCENLVFFEEREDIYGMFEYPQLWIDSKILPPGHPKENIIKTFFCKNNELNLPLVSDYLYIRLNDSQWKRRFCLLKTSRLYVTKQRSNDMSSFRQIITLKPFLHLYTSTGVWSKQHTPTPYGFTLKSCSSKSLEKPVLIHFCAANEISFRTWYSIIRINLTGENILRNYSIRTKLIKLHHTSSKRNTSQSTNKFFPTYDNIGEKQLFQLPTGRSNKSVARVESMQRIKSKSLVHEAKQNNTSSTNSQLPAMSPDTDATGADASSIGWSTNDSGDGEDGENVTGTGIGAIKPHTDDDICGGVNINLNGRMNVRPISYSHSITDLEKVVELKQRRPSFAGSLTSLFSCAVNDKKGESGEHLATVQNNNNEPNKRGIISRSVKKKIFGPSARRCSRSVTHISAPFNVSVPSWVRSSMNDLSRSASMLNSPSVSHPA